MSKTRLSLRKDAHSLPGPDDVRREVLSNGIVVLARANFSSPSVTIGGYVEAGSLFDSDDSLGLADFAATALTRGSSKHSFDGLYNELESVGASIGFDSGLHKTGFHAHGLSEDLQLLLGLLGETMREPTFPLTEIEKLRHHLLTSLAIRMQDTADMADLTFDEILFHDHPYARSEEGNPRTIKAISRADLVRYHRQAFGPRGMVIALVGAVEPKRAVDTANKVFGNWNNPDQRQLPGLPEVHLLKRTVERNFRIQGKSQADVVIGTNGPRRKDDDYMAASLGNSILGQFGMMGRIGKSVREKSGLAYYAYSSLSAGTGPGSWSVSAGVNPANVGKAKELIVKELRRFIGGGVTAAELSDSQANFVGRLPLSLESNGGVASALLNVERYDLGLDYYRRYAGRVKAVRRADVLAAARKYIDPEKLAIATAGP